MLPTVFGGTKTVCKVLASWRDRRLGYAVRVEPWALDENVRDFVHIHIDGVPSCGDAPLNWGEVPRMIFPLPRMGAGRF